MSRFIHISIFGLLLAICASCTSARWTVKEKMAVDESDYKILEQDNFLRVTDKVTPENPVISLKMFSKTNYEFTQRVLMQRNIQDYKLRPGFVALGLGGSAMAFYLANASNLQGKSTSIKSIVLNGVGGLLAISGFLNMKPVGDPRPTGEERFLRSTGTTVKMDTVEAAENADALASIIVRHNGNIIFEEDRNFSSGSIDITLASKLNELQLTGPNPGSISAEVTFEDSVYTYDYSIEEVLMPYAQVTSQLAELRNSPEETPDNVLADLVRGSQLKIRNIGSGDWYQVLYGISENYIRKNDAELLWRSADFIQDEQVVTVPRVPFGNIDVESNIPILRGPSYNSIALIVTNENYAGDWEERNYTHRDGRLIKTYLSNALGYPKQNIFEIRDLRDKSEIYDALADIRSTANDSTELFVYLAGYGSVNLGGGRSELNFLGISDDDAQPEVSLKTLFKEVASIPSSQTMVLGDIDFSASVHADQLTANEVQDIIETTAAPLTGVNSRASLLMGNRLSHPSSLYVSAQGEDKKHHVFPYFFAKALQERRTNLSNIYQYLERNVSYTARRLFDRPQDPLLIGNSSLDLTPE